MNRTRAGPIGAVLAMAMFGHAAPSSPVGAERLEVGESARRLTQGEGPWGAIAYWSFGSTWMAGASANYDTPLYAGFKAREQCGGDGCDVALTLQNECGALAVSVPPARVDTVFVGWAKAGTENAARAAALESCRASTSVESPPCAVEVAVCSGNVAGAGGASSGAAAQLPPEIELDRFLLQADQAVEEGDSRAARAAMERILALQDEHGIEPAPEDQFRFAQVWRVAGEPQRAQAAVTRYLQLLGREAPHYQEALRLLNEAEAGAARPRGGPSSAPAGRGGGGDPLNPPAGPAGMEFVWVPPGEFRMGSTSSDAFSAEQPVTQVRISEGFWLGKYEVTQDEWQAVMGSNPSSFAGCGNCPVERVSWEDVQGFIRRLNSQEGREAYRLPTEAEWEYAARAGTSGDRYGNLDAIAWYGGGRTNPVGGKTPNAWGLHDMLGNVVEWVQDWYGAYPGGSLTDPRGPGSGSARRGHRGGGWNDGARILRAPCRNLGPPGRRNWALGFRLLRTR